LFHIKGRLAFEHKIARPSQLMSEHTERFAFVLLLLQAGQIVLSWLVTAKKQCGRFRKRPLERRLPDFLARGAQAFAPGVFRALHESTLRREILAPGEALNLMEFVEQHKTEDFPHTRHAL
jgi:hypothetical protein